MPKILLVDDDEGVLKTARRMLERARYEVAVARDGNEAMERLAQDRLDLVLIDIIMPDKEGIETIIEIRKQSPDLPIIAMSGGGRGQPGSVLRAAKGLGANAAVEKPFHEAELIGVIDDLLEGKGRCGHDN